MRGKLVLFIALLAAAGLSVSWKLFSPGPRFFIGGPSDSGELETVRPRPGIALASEVRVNLSRTPVSQMQISVDGPYTVHSAGPDVLRGRGEPGAATTVAVLPGGFRLGQTDLRGDSIEIEAERSPAIWVADHQYRGRVRLVRQPGGRMIAVNVVPIEDYIASVVDSEMPAIFPEAARQAQAIAARTYVMFQMQAAGAKTSPFYDVHATTRSQNYLGFQYRGRDGRRYAAETAAGRRAAKETAAMVCLCEGKLFCTYYTAVCGGGTAGGADVFDDPVPALKPVSCEWCKDAQLFEWRHDVPQASASDLLKRYLATRGKPFGKLTSFRRSVRTDNVREPSFEVNDGKRLYRLSVTEIRRLFPSSWFHSLRFDIRLSDGKMMIEGRGHGHGVGLCQWGARGMALAGSGPLAIIRHYYPGAEVVVAR